MEQKDPQYCKEVIAQSILQMEELIKKINDVRKKIKKEKIILADTNHPIPASKKAEKKFVNYYSIIQDQYID